VANGPAANRPTTQASPPVDLPDDMPNPPAPKRPPRSRWTSFVADPGAGVPRTLAERGNPDHRVRVEHNRDTLLVHLSDEDGQGWTVLAVDRANRRWAVAQARRQIDAAAEAFSRLYDEG
jgi:hypothetical protein